MTTQRLYYTDPGLQSFDALVTRAFEHEGRPAAALDRTAFYPSSGGQPFDTGTLDDIAVLDTVDLGDVVAHVTAKPLVEGVRVRGQIDWVRRFDHMQQHTGQHVLSAAFDRLMKNQTVSFHMGGTVSTIDLAHDVKPMDISRAEDEANRVVWEDVPVSIRFVSAGEAASLSLRKEPAREGPLRLIEVAGFDLSACGGTHVARTGAIGLIAVLAAERIRGGTRLTFVCGHRALGSLRVLRDAVAGTVRSLSVLPAELPAAVERLVGDAKTLRKTIKGLQEQLAVHEASRFLAEAPLHAGVRTVVRTLEEWDAAGLKAIASAVAASGHAAAVLMTPSPASVVIARSADVRLDAVGVLQRLVAQFGGKGGGKPDLAQGGGLVGSAAEITDAALAMVRQSLE